VNAATLLDCEILSHDVRSVSAAAHTLAPPAGRPAMFALLVLAGLMLPAALSGCGYAQEVPALPAGARSIAIGEVANLTTVGELDVRLRALLHRQLLRRTHVLLRPRETSDLVVSVTLAELTLTRLLDPTLTADRSFRFALRGSVTLIDRRSGKPLIAGRSLSAAVRRLYPPEVLETPAIRDEGLNDVLAAFAEAVEREVFLVF
jgi:hypothetical protein